jgi:predicted transcriptional regulator
MRTNYSQTSKVLDFLSSKGYVTVEFDDRSRRVKITKQGVLFIRRFNGYYAQTYTELIQEHYRYGRLPAWFRAEV